MRILYCTDQLYKHGGAERVTTTKLNGWVNYTDNEIYLVTTEQKGNSFVYGIDRRVNTYDLEVNYKREISYFNIINILKFIKHVFKFYLFVKEHKPDIVICVKNGPTSLFVPFISGKLTTILEFHSSKISEFNLRNSQNLRFFKKLFFKFRDFVEKKYTYCAILNNSEVKYFKGSNVVVIPNPINIKPYETKYRTEVAVAAGRIAPVKGYDLLIDSWRRVYEKHKNWKLHIYGDGDDALQKELEIMVENLGMEDIIKFYGTTNNLNQVFLSSSIHVLSSREESFGMVILEAQSCGLPTVAFNCPTGPKELIQESVNGFLVEAEDKEALAEKIIFLIENPEIREKMGLNALKNVDKYSVRSIIDIWYELFKEHINQ